MKRALYLPIICCLLFAAATNAIAADDMHWSVQSMKIKIGYQKDGKPVERFRDEYYLYYGNSVTQQTETVMSEQRLFYELYLIHRTSDDLYPASAPHGWYIKYRRSKHLSPRAEALYDEEIWKRIPDTIKNTIGAFGADDPNLMLVSYDIHTHSIKVFFHPKYKDNLKFHEQKLQAVARHFTKRCC